MSEARASGAIVVGGGLAGLAAALRLAERGVRVRVLERRAILGGRAYSYQTRAARHTVDNGQHLLMGCYGRTLGFLRRIGTLDRLEAQPRLSVALAHPARGTAALAAAPLPAPLHLAAGVLRYPHLSLAERVRLLAAGAVLALRYRGGRVHDGVTVDRALTDLGQGENARACFWHPLAIAVLNELPGRASAALFGEVLRRVFFARAAASRILFPRVGLSDLYAGAARRAIEERGGAVDAGRTVRMLEVESGRVARVRLHDGESLTAPVVIAAVPPPALAAMLPAEQRVAPPFAALARLRGAPIVSVHLWADAPLATPRMLGFLDGPVHWLFTPPMQPATGRYVTLVASGAHELIDRDPADVVAAALGALARHLPAARGLRVVDSLVTKERAATFAASPDEQPYRPRAATPLGNLFLAGDWTDTGLPATIESAVESGERAADLAAEALRRAPVADVTPHRVARRRTVA